jgi:hypothetical protein
LGEQAGGKSVEERIRTPTWFKEGAWGNKQELSKKKIERNFYISGGMDYNSARIKPTIFLRNL